MVQKYFLNDISNIIFPINRGDIVFLFGDLASWKTTLSKHLISYILQKDTEVSSPTYVYYNKYGENIYHFDLYRLKNYDEFFAIGAEEILENPNNICIIEWPEIIQSYFLPSIKIYLKKTENENEREIHIL